ncbi:MAG TPA: YtxH domain-containing protein [Chitinophagaceae bacterium]|jgi:gas vesicle protein|nr:YtxH domain-containing protein [Chitinophagaceae bacterium]
MTTKTKIAVGILGAAAAGVVIGLLIAPEKGSDMRKKLRKTANGWADNLSQMFVKGQEEYEEVKEKVKGAKSAAEDKVNKIKESFS